jgi:DNA-directed RNA polymerase specialized sigma subunit
MGNWRFCLLFFRKTSWTLPLPFAALREFENHPLFKLLEVTDMSKNQEERANYYLNIDGQAVPVSEQIYRVYQHYERKEEYFSYDLKTEKFQKETASFLPSREDSYERLLEKDRQFAASGQSVEEQAVSSVWLEELVQCLSADERIILHKLYFEDKSERIASMELGISKTALHQRKVKLLQKLKIFLENMGKA